MSGCTEPSESPHDHFLVGHTATSVSLATGLSFEWRTPPKIATTECPVYRQVIAALPEYKEPPETV